MRLGFILSLSVLLVLELQMVVQAKTDVWKSLALRGERVTALAAAPADPGTIYAGTGSGALFKIVNGMQTRLVQDFAQSNPITAIAVDPRNSSAVYVGTADGVFKSTDAGTTWMVLSWNVIGSVALVVDPQNSDVVYAAADALGLFKSIDAGTNWIRTSLDPGVQSLVIDPKDPAVVYAGTAIGVVKSIDGGANWREYPWTGGMIRGLAIDPATPATLYAAAAANGVFKSTDAGLSWTASGLDSTPVYGLVVDIQETDTVYAATSSGPFKSVDGGRNWFAIREGLDAETTAVVGDLALCKIYVGSDNGVFETDIGPVLTLHSSLCVESAWSVVVSHAPGNAPVRLMGISDGVAWEIPNWSVTNGAGMFTAFGAFPAYTEGSHQLRVDVGAMLSNTLSFTVKKCGP